MNNDCETVEFDDIFEISEEQMAELDANYVANIKKSFTESVAKINTFLDEISEKSVVDAIQMIEKNEKMVELLFRLME